MDTPMLFPEIKIEKIKDRDVIFWGTSNAMKNIKQLLNVPYHIVGYCDNNSSLWGKKIDNAVIMSPTQLKKLLEENPNIIIIIASEFYSEIQQQLKDLEISSEIYISLAMYADGNYRLKKDLKEKGWKDRDASRHIYSLYVNLADQHNEILNSKANTFILSPEKTGNHTIVNSVKGNENIMWLQHSIDRTFPINEEKMSILKRIKKLIIGVRTPIEQNLSILFQKAPLLCIDNSDNGYDIQKMFNKYIVDSICNEEEKRNAGDYGFEYNASLPSLIQTWFDDVLKKELGIDIYLEEFNKIKGYSCYEINGYSIFVYRLDKLKNLEYELGTFIGINNFKLKNSNIGKEKWYSEVYNKFQKEVTFSKEFFDLTYSGKFIKHFYTEEEIMKSKEKWIKHIK